jgi:hypothetical protein
MHQLPDQASFGHDGKRPQLLGEMPRIAVDRADVSMHAGGESVTKPKRQAVATTSQKALEIRNCGTWSFGWWRIRIAAYSDTLTPLFYG